MLEQISVFIENKAGRLAYVMDILHKNNIDIRALTIADTTDFGIVRIIVSETQKALDALKAEKCIANVTNVIGFTIPDFSGALYEVINTFDEHDINIDYSYSLMGKKEGQADIVIRVEEYDKALAVLREKGITLISVADIV